MRNLRSAAAITATALLLIYGIILIQLRGPLLHGYSDFVSLYTAGKILKRGAPQQLYDLRLQYEIQREVAPDVPMRKGALPFVRPAFEAWFFWPFAYLPYGWAFLLWNLVSCGCLVAATLVLRREILELQAVSPVLLIAVALSYFPVFFTLLQGQDSIVLFLVYVLAYRFLRRNRQFASGMTLGLGIFKFPLVVPFLIPFLFKRMTKVIAGFISMAFLLAIISVATIGFSAARYYPWYLLNIDRLAQGVNRPQDMPNLRGLVHLLLPPIPSKAGAFVLIVLSVLALTFLVRKWPVGISSNASAFKLAVALNAVVTVLVSYHCHVFDLSVLLLPMGLVAGFLLSKEGIGPKTRKRLIWALGCLVFSPVYVLMVFATSVPGAIVLLLLVFAAAVAFAISDLGGTTTDKEAGSIASYVKP